MERKLFLIFISIAAMAIGLGGCGDDTSIEREPAGEACPAGGVRIGEGDEAFYICDSTFTEEAPGENCPAGGLRVEDGEGVRYVCNASPDGEDALRIETLPIDEAVVHCGSEAVRIIQPGADEEEKILCIKSAFTYEPLVRVVEAQGDMRAFYDEGNSCEWEDEGDEENFIGFQIYLRHAHHYVFVHGSCTSDILSLLGPPPEGSHVGHHLECAARRNEVERDCYRNAIASADEGICDWNTEEFNDELEHCHDARDPEVDAFCSSSPEPNDEAIIWDAHANQLAALLDCNMSLVPNL